MKHFCSSRIWTLFAAAFAIVTAVVGARCAIAQATQPQAAADSPAGGITQAAPPPTFVGVVTKVDPLSISIRVLLPSPAAGGSAERTFSIDEDTRITVAQQAPAGRQRPGNFGQPNRVAARATPGTVNNLDVGQSVRIDSNHDVALVIVVLAPARRGAAAAVVAEPPARGKVLKIDATSITIGLDSPAAAVIPTTVVDVATSMPSTAPATQPQQRTFRIDDKTRVLVPAAGVRQRVIGFRPPQQQQQQPTPQPLPYTNGALEEVKVGQTVLLREDGDLAIYIAVWPRR